MMLFTGKGESGVDPDSDPPSDSSRSAAATLGRLITIGVDSFYEKEYS